MFVITTRNFPPDIGGMQTLMGNIASSLLEHGQVHVFADAFDGDTNYDKKQKYTIERIKGFKFLKKYRKANQLEIFCSKQKNVKAIIADHWKSLEKISFNTCANVSTLCLIHGKEINHAKASPTHTRMIQSLKKAKFIIANSEFTKKLAIKKGIKASQIIIINPGIFTSISVPKNSIKKASGIFNNASPKFISVTRLEKRKGIHSVILALKNIQVLHPKFLYVIVGDGDEYNSLKNLTRNMDLTNNVIFLRSVDQDTKNALLQKSDIFLMPSIEDGKSVEGFGISFLEASLFKTPCIGGVAGGAADAIKDGKTGYLCDGTKHDEIYQSILKILDPKRLKKMSSEAEKFAKTFAWKEQIKKYLKLI